MDNEDSLVKKMDEKGQKMFGDMQGGIYFRAGMACTPRPDVEATLEVLPTKTYKASTMRTRPVYQTAGESLCAYVLLHNQWM
jgi:hypothetical protein